VLKARTVLPFQSAEAMARLEELGPWNFCNMLISAHDFLQACEVLSSKSKQRVGIMADSLARNSVTSAPPLVHQESEIDR